MRAPERVPVFRHCAACREKVTALQFACAAEFSSEILFVILAS